MNKRRVVSHFYKRKWWSLGPHMDSLRSKHVRIMHFVFEWHWFLGTADQCDDISLGISFISSHDYFTSSLTTGLQNPIPVLPFHLMTSVLYSLRKEKLSEGASVCLPHHNSPSFCICAHSACLFPSPGNYVEFQLLLSCSALHSILLIQGQPTSKAPPLSDDRNFFSIRSYLSTPKCVFFTC